MVDYNHWCQKTSCSDQHLSSFVLHWLFKQNPVKVPWPISLGIVSNLLMLQMNLRTKSLEEQRYVTIYFTIWWKLKLYCTADMRSSYLSPKIFNQTLLTFNRKNRFAKSTNYTKNSDDRVNDNGYLEIINFYN